ncbi:MAG: hypothetical protein RIQ52_999 [Pseudomonadota bacterium]|jgi:Zn-dependent metalloprotease
MKKAHSGFCYLLVLSALLPGVGASPLMAAALPADAVIRHASDGMTVVSIAAHDLAAGLTAVPSAADMTADTSFDSFSLAVLDQYAEVLGLQHPSQELRLLRMENDQLGFTHVVFSQYWRDRPVFDARLLVHWNASHQLYRIDGHYAASPRETLAEPVLDAGAAVVAALRVPGVRRAQLGQPELGIYTQEGKPAALAWRFPLSVSLRRRYWMTLDAGNGALLDRHAMAP